MDVQIFFPGSETASDVSLGFVVFQNFLDLSRKSGIYFKQPSVISLCTVDFEILNLAAALLTVDPVSMM